MKSNNLIAKRLTASILCCLFILFAAAKQIPTVTGIMKTTNYGVSPVVVGFPTAVNLIQVTPLANAQDYKVQNTISLKYDLNADTFFLNKTTLAVKIKVDRWDISNNPMPQVQKKLTIFVDNKLNRATLEQAILKLVNGYKVQVEIDSIWLNGTSVKTLPKWASVESEINLDRYYDFSSAANTVVNLTGITQLDTDCDLITDEIKVNWAMSVPSFAAEEYQLEWSHVNNYSAGLGTYLASALTADFKNNSTRITTFDNSFKISLLFDKGFIAFRVRAVGKNWLNPTQIIYGPWSSPDIINMGSLVNNISLFQVMAEHEKSKNWQYATTYAEEGKKKEVINYFDGSLHNRQTVTKVNSDKNAIVGETMYDFQGRPAINILPVPVTFPNCTTAIVEPSIKYYTNFNVDSTGMAYSKKDFDLDGGTCLPLVRRMDTTSGASKYYSNGNPDKNNQQAFLPHAKKFPFTQIEYTPDNTGRIRNQSGVGKDYKLGTGKETKYLYGQPNQLQVDRLFASETGDASHFKKNVVIDANGQSSVTYLNQEGKTIATALAGIPPNEGTSSNTRMDSLEYANKNQAKFTVDLFNKDALGKSILNAIPPSNDQIHFSTQLLVAFKSLYEFKYDLVVDTVHDLCLRPNICFNCVYDLEIAVKDECGVPLNTIQKVTGKFIPGSPITFATNCSGPTVFTGNESFNLVLDPGVYTVSKTLKINKSAKDFYVKSFADSLYNKCFKTLKQFEAEELAKIDTMDCYTSCASCVTALGKKDDFVSSGQGTALQWEFLVQQCNEPCKQKTLCQVTYDMMLSDVSPGGQYGKFNSAIYNASSEPLSVFNPSNKLTPNILGGAAHWRSPKFVINNVMYYQYLDENGVRTKVDLIETSPGVYVPQVANTSLVFTDPVTNTKQTYPENLVNLSDFIPLWDPGFAKSLVLYHPEYAYYVSCAEQGVKWSGDNKSSDNLDSLLNVTETFAQAVTNGFIKSSNWNLPGPTPLQKIQSIWNTTAGPYDPFFTNTAYQYATTLNQNGLQTTINMTGPNAYNVNLQAEMNNIINNYRFIGSTPYSMADVAAVLARCGNNFFATPTAACLKFGLDYSPSFTPAQNDSVRNREWNFYKQFYIAEKQKLQFKRMNFYAKHSSGGFSNYYGGCNACIGTSAYNPWASGMIYPFPNQNYPVSAFYDGSQPCHPSTSSYYTGVTKRFYDPANTNLNTNVAPIIYQMTGQCPLAFHLQNLMNAITSGSKLLVNNLSLSTISEFNPDLYLAVSGGPTPPPSFINYQWQVITSTGNVFKANIVDPSTSTVKCTFTIDITGTSIPNFTSIKGINQLVFDPSGTGSGSYKAVAVYVVGTSTLSANIKGDASCLNINGCNFSEQCYPNQFASDMQALLNFVKSAGQLNSVTPYAINLDNAGKLFLTSTIKTTLSSVPASNSRIKYQFIFPDKYTLYDSTDVNTKIVLTFLTITPAGSLPGVVTFANIRSNYSNQFKLDGMNGSNVKVSDIDGKAERVTPTQTIGISMGNCSLPQLPECQQKEHNVRRDLELLVKEMLSSKPFNNYNFNIYNLASFSPLLKSYFNLTSTTGSHYIQTGPSPNVDTLRVVLGGTSGCTFKLYHWRNNSTVLNFPNIVNVTDLVGIGTQDIAGNYKNFRAIATYSYGTQILKDTIYGNSCWPIKNCVPCPTPTVSQQAIAQKDSALVAAGKAFFDPSLPAYSEYKEAVDSVNTKNGWSSSNPNYVTAMSYAEFADKGYSNAPHLIKFMLNFDSVVDSKAMLNPETFVYQYGNLENCNKDYQRYVNATAAYNIRAVAVSASTLSVIKDSVFYHNHLCDTSYTYVRYLKKYPALGPNPQDILAFFGITNPYPVYLDSCKTEYDKYQKYHIVFSQDAVVQASCKEANIMHPLYSYDDVVKRNLCASQQGFNMFKGYVNSIANATIVCPPALPEFQIIPGIIAPIGPLCQRYYITMISKINAYNASPYAIANSYTLNPNIYPTFYSFQLAGYCDCVINYINYLNTYIALPANSTWAPPVDIDSYPGCPHAIPPVGSDSCRKQHIQYTQAINAFNNFVLNNPGLGYAPISTVLGFQEYVANYCNCGKKFIAGLYSIINGFNPSAEDVKPMTDIDFVCSKPCNNGPPDSAFVFPPYTKYDNPCVQQQINLALQNAANSYQQYLDSITTYFADKYTRHCLNAFENFDYKYVDKEYHFTLYYYDQAGNLIKTVPPEGVEPVNVTSYTDAKEQQIISDRTYNQQNVFTEHRMATTYIYNSLNQLIFQSLPDHDNMDICDGANPSGLDTGLVINTVQFVTPNKGYLCGYIRNGAYKRGLVYTSNDGGGTWVKINGVTSGNLQKVQFVNPSVGFAVSNFGMVFKTVDGGTNWDLLTGLYNPTSGPRFTGLLSNLTFTSTNFGVVGGVRNGAIPFLYYTNDGGNTFTPANVTGSANGDSLTGVTFDGTVGGTFIAATRNGNTGALFQSTDGINWTKINNYITNNLRKVQYINNSVAFAVGEEGTLLKSNPPNTMWTLVPTSQLGNFNDVYFKSATDGIALIDSVPGKAKLYKTFNGGITWEQFGANGDYYSSFQAYDAANDKLVAVGQTGLGYSLMAKIMMNTPPFGLTKIPTLPISIVTPLNYMDVIVNNPNNVLFGVVVTTVTSFPNYIYTTYNAQVSNPIWFSHLSTGLGIPAVDATFKKVLVSYSGSSTAPNIQALLLTTTGKLYAFYRPYNANPSVLPVTVSGSSPFIVDITSNNQSASTSFYAFDNTNKVIHTINFAGPTGAATFDTPHTNANPVTGNIKSIEISNSSNEMLIVGDNGYINYCAAINLLNNTWVDVSKSVVPTAFTCVKNVAGTNNFMAIGIDGAVWKNATGGITDWQLKNSGTIEKLNSFASNPSGTGLIAANNGKLYHLSLANTQSPQLVNIPTSVTSNLTDVSLEPFATQALITSEGGHVLYTPTYLAPVPSVINTYSQPLNGVTYRSNFSNAVVVGNNAFISNFFNTTSNVTQNIYTKGLNSIHFHDVNNGFVIDSNDVIRYTANGGNTWSVVLPSNNSPKLNKVFTTKPNQGVVIGNNKYAAVINNTALSTLIVPATVPAGTDLYDIHFNASKFGVIAGSATRAMKIVPLGVSAFAVSYIGQAQGPPKVPNFYAVHVFNDSTFICAGSRGTIYYHKAGTFYLQTSYLLQHGAVSTQLIFKDLFFHDNYAGYVVGDNGQAFKLNLSTPIKIAGAAVNSLPWQPFCTDAVYINYVTNTQRLNLDFRSISFASRTDGMLAGADNNIVIAGITPNKYSRLLKEQSGYYSTRFWYDKLGRLILSQNTKQFNKKNPINNLIKQAFSYTLYDNLGRIVEVGEKFENHVTGSPKFNSIFGSIVSSYYNTNVIDDAKLQLWISASGPRREVTKTYYDNQTILPLTYTQNNLRKRVATTTYENQFDGNDLTYQHATHYSYDIHGNVARLWQENTQVAVATQSIKQIDYQFDLISGKVNKVIYSPGEVDQFIHRYVYDADNRIRRVETSKDDITYELDAKYFYYHHGPLARVEYGKDHVQGVDYAYTLQGWIKGINSNALKKAKDIGRDGDNSFVNPNGNFARDVMGYSLNYFKGDYEAIDFVKWNTTNTRFEAYTNNSDLMNSRNDLFNGNITAMVTTISKPDSLITGQVLDPIALPMGNAYRYDQLNRIKRSKSFTNIDTATTNSWLNNNASLIGLYRNTFTYDANGNIISQIKRDSLGNVLDSLVYQYETVGPNKRRNRLYHVRDAVNTPAIPGDIEDQGTFTQVNVNSNYRYDEIGNLIHDSQEEIDNIEWMVTGKIKAITRTTGSSKDNLVFDYDATGNRIAKHVYTSANVWKHSTYYLRDAQGNVMSVYDKRTISSSMSYKLDEQHLYGSSRIGMTSPDLQMIGAVVNNDSSKIYLGYKSYELSNHLGNVLTVISDKKIQIPQTANITLTDHYVANIISASDYYPFGSVNPGRNFSSQSYRYGMNGMEKDNEVKGSNNSYDFGARVYDPRLGRWLGMDPLHLKYPNLSPYNYSENNPIYFADTDGKDAIGKVEGNNITITSQIIIIGSGATKEKAAQMQKDIMKYYGKKFTYTDESGKVYNVKFDIKVKVNDVSKNVIDKGTNIVRLIDSKQMSKDQLMDDGKFRSFVQDGWYGQWDNTEKPSVYAHEVGHMLGIADAYVEYKEVESNLNPNPSKKTYTSNYPSASNDEIMGVASNSEGMKPKVTKRDIDAIAKYIIKNMDKSGVKVLDKKANLNAPTMDEQLPYLGGGHVEMVEHNKVTKKK